MESRAAVNQFDDVLEAREIFLELKQRGHKIMFIAATTAMARQMGWKRRDRRKYRIVVEDLPGRAVVFFYNNGDTHQARIAAVCDMEAGSDTMENEFLPRIDSLMRTRPEQDL